MSGGLNLQTLEDVKVRDKRVLVRVDFNVPIKEGRVGEAFRIRAALATIKYLRAHDARVILASHLGRPDGRVVPAESLRPVVPVLAKLLGCPVEFASDCVGPEAESATQDLKPKGVLLLENLRFHAGEEADDPQFARALADLAEVYVDDAFAAIHRAHASIVGIASLLPSAAGRLVEHEVTVLDQVLHHPAEPFVAIIGGAKVSTKIEILDNLLKKVDVLAIGGAMANTFLLAQGYKMGHSLVEPDFVPHAKKVLTEAKNRNVKVILPVDLVVAHKAEDDVASRIVGIGELKSDDIALDLGPQSVKLIADSLPTAKMILWNGTLGVSELKSFAKGSRDLAHAIIKSPAYGVVGGGDTGSFVEETGLADQFDFVSTGGGASLEFLSGKQLPGIRALTK